MNSATVTVANPLAVLYDPAYLYEPMPWVNRKSTVLGVIITATVRPRDCCCVQSLTKVDRVGLVRIMEVVRPVTSSEVSRMG